MTVVTTTFYTDWVAADGFNKNWSYDFTIFNLDDVIVQVRDGTDDSTIVEYTSGASLVPNDDTFEGGYVVYPVSGLALANTKQVRLVREVPYTQSTEIGREGVFSPIIHERAFDKLTMLVQQLYNATQRAILVPLGSLGYSLTPGIAEGHTLMIESGKIAQGPSLAQVETVADNIEAIIALGDAPADIATVAGIADDVTTTAANETAIQTVAANIASIIAASESITYSTSYPTAGDGVDGDVWFVLES